MAANDVLPPRVVPEPNYLLPLAAAPTFAIMALVSTLHDGGMPNMLCTAAHDASALTGMVPMYMLMSALHLPPWLNLATNRRSRNRYPAPQAADIGRKASAAGMSRTAV